MEVIKSDVGIISGLTNHKSLTSKRLLPVVALLLTYFLLRLFFQQLPAAKQWFIYSSGVVVDWFYNAGIYLNGEWLFGFGSTRFVLGASCSGTTFFSLLLAYLIYRRLTHRIALGWLLLAFPMTICANAMRVMSSMYAHNSLVHFNLSHLGAEAHVLAGVFAFFCSFLLIAYVVERPAKGGLQ